MGKEWNPSLDQADAVIVPAIRRTSRAPAAIHGTGQTRMAYITGTKMSQITYTISIGDGIEFQSALATLRVAACASEAILGPGSVEMDVRQQIDDRKRTITIGGDHGCASHVTRVAVHLLRCQFGQSILVGRARNVSAESPTT